MVTASSKSAKVPVLVASSFSAALTDALPPASPTRRSSDLTPNEVTAVLPSALVAVTVTEYGASSSPLPDRHRVPLGLPDWLMFPVEAVMVTASSKSAKVPVLVAATFSAALTEALSAATVGATSVNDTPNEVTAVLPSALVAVTVTEYGASSSPL